MDCVSACVAVNSAVARTTSAIFRFVRHARESRNSLANLSAELYALDGIVTMLREDAAVYVSPYATEAQHPPSEDPGLAGDIARLTPVVVSASGVLVGALELLFHKYGKKRAGDTDLNEPFAAPANGAAAAAASSDPSESYASDSWPVVKKFVAELRPGLEIYRLALGLSLDLTSLTNSETPISAFEPDISRILAEISHLRLRIRAACRDTQTVAVLQAYLDLLQRLAATSLEKPEASSIVHRLIPPGNHAALEDGDDDDFADRCGGARRLHSYRSSGSLRTASSSACPPINELDHVLDDVLDGALDHPPTPPPRSAARPPSRRSHHHSSSSASASASTHEPLLDIEDAEPFPSVKPEAKLGRSEPEGEPRIEEEDEEEADTKEERNGRWETEKTEREPQDQEARETPQTQQDGPITRRMTQAFGSISVASSPYPESTHTMANVITANSVDTASTARTNAIALNTAITTTNTSSSSGSGSGRSSSVQSNRSHRTKSFDTPVTMSSIGSASGSGGGSGGASGVGSGSGSGSGSAGGSATRGSRAFWPFKKKNMAAVEASSVALSAAVGLTPPVSREPSRRLSASLRALSSWTSGTGSLDRSSSRTSGRIGESGAADDEDDDRDNEDDEGQSVRAKRVVGGGAGGIGMGGDSDIPEDGVSADAVFGVALRKSIRVASTTARTRHGGQGHGGGQGGSSDGGGGHGGGSSSRRFPLCIFRCYQFLSENVNTPDLFGTESDEGLPLVDARQLQRLRTAFSTGPLYGADLDVDLAVHGYTPHDGAALILQFLEELPRPLVSESVLKRWITLSRQATQAGDAGRMKHDEGLDFWAEALQGVGGLGLGFGFGSGGGGKKNNVSTAAASRNLLKLLLNLWGDIADAADATNMTAERLAASVLRPLIHAPLATSRRSTDYMLALAFIIRRRSEYSQLLRGGRRKSRAAFET